MCPYWLVHQEGGGFKCGHTLYNRAHRQPGGLLWECFLRAARALQVPHRRCRGRVISFRAVSTALIFLNFGRRKLVKRAQRRGTTLKTDKNVARTTPHSKILFTKQTIFHTA